MAPHDETTAGAEAPAVAASGPGAAADWEERNDPPLYRATIWPHRSRIPGGRRRIMLIAAAGFSMPLLAAAGTRAFWGLLPFCLAGLGMLWLGLARSAREGRLVEELTLWRDEIRVERREPTGRVLRWRAFPGFVHAHLHPRGPVKPYLTLTGGGREIELGRALTAPERIALKAEIDAALAALR
ncbi:DUF2244 domain-containing protein [Paralimibaculum aggregatum]|uniref:DUF2244 domain-containing protein n=1 Tax=Paralimibaculum aggregatum TaxID=3036245 RepID=A0ABQ6LS02_9RHOB|nr:DUF2244 domain-containing protein [Limibaculum sp. NKW23]GMG84381.1 DUF2244 domain-containing protein [Limibaculum sp. NKW23]